MDGRTFDRWLGYHIAALTFIYGRTFDRWLGYHIATLTFIYGRTFDRWLGYHIATLTFILVIINGGENLARNRELMCVCGWRNIVLEVLTVRNVLNAFMIQRRIDMQANHFHAPTICTWL